MSIPLVQTNDKDSINTSIIAIKRNIERINMLLGLSNSEEIDTSKFATKEELQQAVTDLQPVDEVTVDNMHSVSSNAVAKSIKHNAKLIAVSKNSYGDIDISFSSLGTNVITIPNWTVIENDYCEINNNVVKIKKSGYYLLNLIMRFEDLGSGGLLELGVGYTFQNAWSENNTTGWFYVNNRPSGQSSAVLYLQAGTEIRNEVYISQYTNLKANNCSIFYVGD